MGVLYDKDFYGWAKEQAALLRAGKLSDADVGNIAEELESMGRSAQEQLTNRLAALLSHLLKWRYQPGIRGNSWRLTVAEQRRRIARLTGKNPSLKSVFAEVLADAYGDAVLVAERETGLPPEVFSTACPWTFDAAMRAELE